jgi:uncharacterized membrane protein
MAMNMLSTFGTNVSVCSWIDVIVWNILTISPTTSDITSIGADVLITQNSAFDVIVVTSLIVIGVRLFSPAYAG